MEIVSQRKHKRKWMLKEKDSLKVKEKNLNLKVSKMAEEPQRKSPKGNHQGKVNLKNQVNRLIEW